MSDGILLRRVEVDGDRIVDVRVRDGIVFEIGDELPGARDEEIIDGESNALIPGLHDHHMHVLALAASFRSIRCGPRDVADRASLAGALREAAARTPPGGWVRGVGYHESVAGLLDRNALDEIVDDKPVRLQHRGGALWMLNGAALRTIDAGDEDVPGLERDAAGRATGRLWRLDAWLRARMRDDAALDLNVLGRRLAAFGITGVTDATPDIDQTALDLLGSLPQRIHVLGATHDARLPPRMSIGPRKILLPDHDLPPLDAICEQVRQSHADGRPVAVHCVTREALLLTLAVLDDAGALAGDRIEHAAIVPPGVAADIARLGVRVVTQPSFIAERGDDYLRDVASGDRELLYPYASLLAAGVQVAPSGDAPFGDADPWRTMAAARDRLTPSGVPLGADERVAVRVALDGFLSGPDDPGGPPRTITAGAEADLCLLRVPLASALSSPDSDIVRLTLCRGAVI